jgi:hypothetical protein
VKVLTLPDMVRGERRGVRRKKKKRERERERERERDTSEADEEGNGMKNAVVQWLNDSDSELSMFVSVLVTSVCLPPSLLAFFLVLNARIFLNYALHSNCGAWPGHHSGASSSFLFSARKQDETPLIPKWTRIPNVQ